MWIEVRLKQLRREWDSKSNDLQWMLTHGGGIENIHIHDALRSMTILYERIAAMQEAVRNAKGEM